MRASQTIIISLLLSICCLLFTCKNLIVPELPDDIPEAITNPHVEVGCVRESDGRFEVVHWGSGVAIGSKDGKTYVLTALHVVVMPPKEENVKHSLVVWTEDKNRSIYAQLEENAKHGLDAVVISTRLWKQPIAKISERDTYSGQKVFVLGTPAARRRSVYRRTVERFGGKINGRFRYQWRQFILDDQLKPGFSGGGVYNSSNELVGMCYASDRKKKKGICIPISTLMHLVKPFAGER